MPRRLVGELMDDPRVDPSQLRRALRFIRLVNRLQGGIAHTRAHVARLLASLPAGSGVSLLDVATGSADVPLALLRWARARRLNLTITAVDLHATTLDLAREHIAGEPSITLVQADALRLDALFPPASFDLVHAGLFLHHLRDDDVVTALAQMHRVARRALVINDLWRTPLAAAAIHLLTLGQPRLIRHDACASVDAAFTPAELHAIARRAGLAHATIHTHPLTQRLTLVATAAPPDQHPPPSPRRS